ncbi:ATP-binding cassette domain-containing protein [Microbacterium sp. ARD32]|uniref:ATP-binding cassette domain-containing protein n=1 Tax=Microbacterium sp. ARD32 TaxID=2962577 RepID=UPI0028827BF0|nr:ATP-binding cassette domain-containing protein [Microbacterium sp. ARD32]MDT0158638.1 ATP-binding cassette domain-containing protein [Microbacterium sp. ARD32]
MTEKTASARKPAAPKTPSTAKKPAAPRKPAASAAANAAQRSASDELIAYIPALPKTSTPPDVVEPVLRPAAEESPRTDPPAPEAVPEPVAATEPAPEAEPTPEAAPEPVLTAEPTPETAPETTPETEPASAEEADAARDPAEPDPDPADPDPAEPDAVVVAGPPADSEPAADAIRIRGLVKRFGDSNAVDGIDLTVPAGSFYGLVGPNGAGKTTTLSIIAGLLRADAGSVHICGIDQKARPLDAKRVMGVLPDRLRTFDRLTGRQLLHYYGQLRGLKRAVIEKRVADLARAFDLTEALGRVVSDYSAGMTKKIMLAGALIHSPRVLVLDEPFEAVDPVSSGVILDILRSYVAHGGTVILSSHGMDLVEQVCSRVAVIVGGDVLAEGTVDEVRAGQTLAARFVELSGTGGEVEGLEWLHTFSG